MDKSLEKTNENTGVALAWMHAAKNATTNSIRDIQSSFGQTVERIAVMGRATTASGFCFLRFRRERRLVLNSVE